MWNREHEPVASFVEVGATAALSPAAAAAEADIVLTMVADGNAVADVLGGPSGVLAGVRPGTIWIQMATIGLEWTERFGRNRRRARRGVRRRAGLGQRGSGTSPAS